MEEKTQHAIVKTGGKQYTVIAGTKVLVSRLAGEIGEAVTLKEVLLISDGGENVKVGTPLLSGATVTAKITAHPRGKKVYSYRKKIKTGFTKTRGHRHDYTELLIESIKA